MLTLDPLRQTLLLDWCNVCYCDYLIPIISAVIPYNTPRVNLLSILWHYSFAVDIYAAYCCEGSIPQRNGVQKE